MLGVARTGSLNLDERLRKVVKSSSYHGVGSRNAFFQKLPEPLIRLRILKLDGTFFDISVAKNATIAELKREVREAFSTSPEEGDDSISWLHVWGHFCLSHGGQKLLNDKACLRNFRIMDGDQLHFVHHLSINQPLKTKYKGQRAARKQYSAASSESNAHESNEGESVADYSVCSEDGNDSSEYPHSECDDKNVPMSASKFAQLFRGWLPYSKLQGGNNKRRPGMIRLLR